MKTLSPQEALTGQETDAASARPMICMHVLGTAYSAGRALDARVMREATALNDAGFRVTIVDAARGGGVEYTGVHQEGVCVRHIRMPSWFVPSRFKPWFLVKALRMLWLGMYALRAVPADVYHAHDFNALPACYLVARLRHKPLVFDSHEIPLDDPAVARWRRLSRVARGLLRRMLPRCAGVITTSPLYAREISTQYHFPEITLIRNFPFYQEVARNDRLKQRLGLSQETRIALYQGGIQPNRTLDRLVNAAPFLDPGIVIVLMGMSMEETRRQLEQLIAEKDLSGRVKMLPAVPYEELLYWTASADLGLAIFTPDYTRSIRYCLPNKLFEYLMAGLPVLASDLAAVAEVLTTYGVGRVLDSLAPEDVARAINALLADTAELERMRQNALSVARREFHWDREGQRLVQFYQTIVSS